MFGPFHYQLSLAMKNILDDADRAEILSRFGDLAPETERQWGTLTAPEMVCHLKDFMSVAVGDRDASFAGSWFTRLTVVWKMVFYVLPWGAGQLETPKEVDPKWDGSRPGDFADDKAEVRRLLARFVETPEEDLATHPIVGRISKRDWGRAIWRNFDHHLQQFGL